MTDFFKELEDDIRDERIVALWHKYGNLLIGLALAIVIGTAGYTLWKYIRHKNQLSHSTSFSQAVTLMNQGKKEEAVKAFQSLAQKGGGYGKLAQLYEASLLPNPEPLYTKISQANKADPALGNLPKVLMAARALNQPAILDKLQPLTAPTNAWAPLSLELLALADLKRGDEVKAAEKYLQILEHPSLASDRLLFRASLMLSQLDVPASLLEEKK